MDTEYRFEICNNDDLLAAGTAATPRDALREAGHYENQYREDGPLNVQFFIVHPVRREYLQEQADAFGDINKAPSNT